MVLVIVFVLIVIIIIIELTLHSVRNTSEQGWLLCNKMVHCHLLGSASLVMLPLSFRAAPFRSRHPSLVTLHLSPLSLPLSSLVGSLVAHHHSPLCQEQGWLLFVVLTVHRRLTTLLGAPGSRNRYVVNLD